MVYCSEVTVPTESLLFISQILSVSQRNNTRDGLTGALAISDGWFLQVIEGEKDHIDHLLRRLVGDTRHKNLEVLDRQPIKERLFAEWSMCSARITPDVSDDIQAAVADCRQQPTEAVGALRLLVASTRDLLV